MRKIADITALERLYGKPGETSLKKVVTRITPEYRKWIAKAKFCVLTTVGPDGTDGSPRGDDGPAVTELDPETLAMPDWRGNNRLDSLRNIVVDGRVSLMFMIPGSNNLVRVNGHAIVTDDAALRARFEKKGRQPATVIVINITEIYFQCARALLRADLWNGNDQSADLPSAGDMLHEASSGAEGGADYDKEWPGRAAKSMW